MRELAARYLDGTATSAEVEQLSALLRTDEQARLDYLRLAEVHARLATDTAIWVREKSLGNPPMPSRWRRWLMPLTAAAVVVVAAASLRQMETGSLTPVATLLRADDARWAGEALLEGQRLNAGLLRLSAGSALLRLDGGALVLLSGAVELRIDNGGSLALLAGEIHAQVPEAAAGFTVHTPGGEVVDLGTEFIARVSPDKVTEVAVVRGEVELRPSQGAPRRLTTGKAIALQQDGGMHEIAARLPKVAWEDLVHRRAAQRRADTLLAQDTFDYPEGSHEPSALTGGRGWEGPWSLLTDPQGARLFSGGSRTMEITVDGDVKAWLAPAGKTFRQRRLAQPIDLSHDAIYYASLSWFEEALPSALRTATASPASGASVTLRSLDPSAQARVSLRVDHQLRPRIETGAGQGFISRVRVPEGRRLLLVAKLLSRRNSEDEVLLRVFDTEEPPGPWEPAEWDIRTRGLRLDAVLDHVILQSSGPQPRRIEELRLSRTWQDAVAGWSAEMTNDE